MREKKRFYYLKYGKRIIDIILSFLGLIMLAPLLGIIALLIKLQDGGSIFFTQDRIGYKMKKFKIYKFRTMVENAENLGPPVTGGNDPRITKLGAFLRKYKLDELPQLINVLKGDMSLVGPRPEVEKYVRYYEQDFKNILSIVKPGITDYATLEFKNEEEILKNKEDVETFYVKSILPKKIEMYKRYINEVSLLTDIHLILRTVKRIIK